MFQIVTVKSVKDKIGLLCKTQRKKKGLSREELAEALVISKTTIQNVENGKNATLDTVLKIAYHFDLLSEVMNALEQFDDTNIPDSLY